MLFSKEKLDDIAARLIKRQQTIAVAESVTSGLLQVAFSGAQDASCFFQGGITAYHAGQKYRHLLVEPIWATACDCVSEEVSAQMARGVCQMFRSHYGIAITGYATPVPEKDIMELHAWIAVCLDGEMLVSEKILPAGSTTGFDAQLSYTTQVVDRFHSLGQ